MTRPGMVIKFTVKPENTDRFAALLEQAAPLVERAENGTTPWMAVRASEADNVFFVVDLYADADAMQAHLDGEAAALVLGEGGKLLELEPEVVTTRLLSGVDVG